MRLAAFIRAHTEQIVVEWENFARTLVPATEGMSSLALRDHIRYLLTFIANDIEASQTDSEQVEKSKGMKPKTITDSAAEIHASERHAGGFNMDQMVSEYRALRASVVKLWHAQLPEEPQSRDISDLTRFNESIDQALTESISHYSKKLDHARNLFLGILGHDLRNPLGAIQMSAQLALKIGGLNERQTMLATQVGESAVRATEIVTHLLDLTKARLGSGLPILKEMMDMEFVTRQLVDEMRAMHPECTFNLEISGDAKGKWDKPRIGQVLSNLLGNAVQYGFQGMPITVKILGNASEVLLTVHNHGVPIPTETIGKIFDSMTRGDAEPGEDEAESTNLGLGLYIVKEIVNAHGGTILVSSSEQDGTMFTARFPRG